MPAPTAPKPTVTKAAPPPARPQPNRDIVDEKSALARFDRLKKLVTMQVWVIAALAAALVLVLPFALPSYVYFAMKPDKKIMKMVGLEAPNMTNRALLSWATTSITEIMTMGFGDMDVKLPQQKWRFTQAGWDAYIKAFVETQTGKTFRQNQLVLTTVPSNTPVILAQGINIDHVYQWNVEMPVIMTFATNNNVTRQKDEVISLQIVRVPVKDSPSGIAIKSWN